MRPVVASVTKTMASASAIAARTCVAMPAFMGSSSAGSYPPVSTTVYVLPKALVSAYLRSRVTPGSSCTMAMRARASRLKSVDLPTLGRPTIATMGVPLSPPGMEAVRARGAG